MEQMRTNIIPKGLSSKKSNFKKAHKKIQVALLCFGLLISGYLLCNHAKTIYLSGVGTDLNYMEVKQHIPSAAQSAWSNKTMTSEGNPSTAVTTSRLNIRSGPGTKYRILCTVPSNTKLMLTGGANMNGTWVLVRASNGITGWCCQQYLNMDFSRSNEASAAKKYFSAAVTTRKLNIRSGPGTKYAIVCTVPCYTKLKLTGKANTDSTWVQVKTSEGKAGWCCRPYLKMDAVDTSTSKELTPATVPLYIRVSLNDQKVSVNNGKGLVIKTFPCSSGKSGSETPTGTFTVSGRGKSFYNSSLGEGAYYWTSFCGNYLFHSIPFDENYQIERDEAAKLGMPASHGCIRLSIEDAKWIYDHIPDGTKVIIK